MAELKKTSDAARKKSFINWTYGNLTCFSQEHMQTFGYLAAMLPIVDELYEDEDEKVEKLRTYTTFFNTEPQIGTMVVGLTVGLEEALPLDPHDTRIAVPPAAVGFQGVDVKDEGAAALAAGERQKSMLLSTVAAAPSRSR